MGYERNFNTRQGLGSTGVAPQQSSDPRVHMPRQQGTAAAPIAGVTVPRCDAVRFAHRPPPAGMPERSSRRISQDVR
jgi:hypothetical protein